MPIYEYRCNECGTHVERRQSISEAPLTICEKCGGLLEKQVSLSGFQFKGAGWYVTDYAAKKAPGGETKSTMAIQRVMGLLQSPVNTYALSECGGKRLLLTHKIFRWTNCSARRCAGTCAAAGARPSKPGEPAKHAKRNKSKP